MNSTALGVRDLFNSVSVDTLVVKDSFVSQGPQVSSTVSVVDSLMPTVTNAVDIGNSTQRFKRAFVSDLDVGVSNANKYLKTNAEGIVTYGTVDTHNPVSIGTGNGLSLSNQQLSLATASSSSAGALSATDKVIVDKLNADLLGSTINVGVSTNPAINTINIGTGTGPTTLNLGGPGDTVVIQGTTIAVETQNAQVKDAVLTLNKGGLNANSVGLEILGADPTVAASLKTDSTGNVLELKAGSVGAVVIDAPQVVLSSGNIDIGSLTTTTLDLTGTAVNVTSTNGTWSTSGLAGVTILGGAGKCFEVKAPLGNVNTSRFRLDADGTTNFSSDSVSITNAANTNVLKVGSNGTISSSQILLKSTSTAPASTYSALNLLNSADATVLDIKGDGTTSGTCDLMKLKPSTWTLLSLNSAFSHYPSPFSSVRYMLVANSFVRVMGLLQTTRVISANQVMGVLPVGFRPVYQYISIQIVDLGSHMARVDVHTDGTIMFVNAFSTSGAVRALDTNEWFNIDLMFPIA